VLKTLQNNEGAATHHGWLAVFWTNPQITLRIFQMVEESPPPVVKAVFSK
jgi:hypothetical protein